jgi:hypothetical protein
MAVITTVLILVSTRRMMFSRRRRIICVLLTSGFFDVRMRNSFGLCPTIQRGQESEDEKESNKRSETHNVAIM